MNKNTAIIALLTISILSFSGIAYCQPALAQAKSKAVAVKVVEAALADITEEFNTTGSLVADNAVTVRSIAEGPISFFPWREGDRVEVGARLIEIDRPLYLQEMKVANSSLEVAKARLADLIAGTRREEIAQAQEMVNQRQDSLLFAEKDHERVVALVKSGALPVEMEEKSRVSFVKAKTDLTSAQQKLSMLKAGPTRTEIAVLKALVDEAEVKAAMARAKYEECSLVAPFAGVITKTYVRTGDLATPRAPLLDLMDDSSLMVRFSVPEIFAAKVKTGHTVRVKLDAYPGKDFQATVKRVFSDLEKTTRTRLIEATINDAQVELIPGMFARVSADLSTQTDAVVIPDEAVLTTPRGEKVVFTVVDGRAVQKTIVTGIEQHRSLQVLEGLKSGELVVTEGSRGLKDKMAVAIINAVAVDQEQNKLPGSEQKGDVR